MDGPGWHCNTFTIVARCPRQGLLGIALTSSPIAAAARCSFIRANLGAVSTQAYAHPGLGPLALNLLELGYTPEKALDEIRSSDRFPEHRQLGIVDRNGRSAVFTGKDSLDWRGHRNGLNYVVMGNYLVNGDVVPAMEDAWLSSEDEILEERLVRAVEAGKDAGGEKGGHLSAGLLVYGRDTYARTDLRVDFHRGPAGTDAVNLLRDLFEEYRPMIPYYEERPENPLLDSWRVWREKNAPGRGR
jgi:uncharacterized Ntn-hydrolase superfamily protein